MNDTQQNISHRLCDLLLQFPGAALGGVQWNVLCNVYEECHGTKLDVGRFGHNSPLVAAHAFLWDVLRLVKKEDAMNPVVAVEDELALTARPGCMACWPSLYSCLSSSVKNVSGGLPLSQVSVLLEHRWHREFDEGNLHFVADDGTRVEVTGLRHLVQHLLQWRAQRLKWQQGNGRQGTTMDEALSCDLELVEGANPTDPVLRHCAIASTKRLTFLESPIRSGMELKSSGVMLSLPLSARKSFGSLPVKSIEPVAAKSRLAVRSFHQSSVAGQVSPPRKAVGDRGSIPSGIVQRFRSQIECSAK